MVELAYVFKDRGKVEEVLPKCQLSKNTYWYIRSALVDSHDNHVCTVFGSKESIMCLMPHDTPSNLFRKHGC